MTFLHTKQRTPDKKLFFIIFAFMLIIFVFSSDAHRATFDEDTASQQAKRIATWQPHPDYVQDETKLHFEHPRFKNNINSPICINGILCTTARIGHSLTEVPLIFINHNLNIITKENTFWTTEDFNEPHYVWWRNSLESDLIFMELFYGPIISALSVGIFFLVCRTFDFSQKISLTLALIFGLSTLTWAYSQTSLNSVPLTLFILLGFLFFRKFQRKSNSSDLLLSAIFLGFAFLVRQDAIVFIAPIFIFLILSLKKDKIRNFVIFAIPPISAYLIDRALPIIRFAPRISEQIQESTANTSISVVTIIPILANSYPLYQGGFGLLLSPGVGLLIFCPILFLIFVSFPDFFKRNKQECILFIVFFGSMIVLYGTIETWHGLVSWGARYLLPIIPFLILPIGASIEQRPSFKFKTLIIVLASIGVFINIAYLIQDVGWFVWGWPGQSGLFGIDKFVDGVRHGLNLDPVVFWTFEYSQLTHAILGLMYNVKHDIFLVKILTLPGYIASIMILLSLPVYYLIKIYSLNSSENKIQLK